MAILSPETRRLAWLFGVAQLSVSGAAAPGSTFGFSSGGSRRKLRPVMIGIGPALICRRSFSSVIQRTLIRPPIGCLLAMPDMGRTAGRRKLLFLPPLYLVQKLSGLASCVSQLVGCQCRGHLVAPGHSILSIFFIQQATGGGDGEPNVSLGGGLYSA